MLDVLHRREHRLVLFFRKAARFFLYAALILIPLAYLPWTSDALEINKQTVLVFCAILALLSWLASFIVLKSLEYKKTSLHVWLIILLAGVLISSCMSLAPWTSVFGGMGQEYVSLVSWVAMIVLFLVGVNVLDKKDSIYRAVDLVFIVSVFILLFGTLSVFGVNVFAENFIGSPNAMGVIAVMALVMALGFGFLQKDFFDGERGLLSKTAALCSRAIIPLGVIVLYGLDYWFLWALTVLGVAIIFSVMLLRDLRHVTLSRIFLPVMVLVISLVFMFVPTPGGLVFPVEVAPTYSSSYQIAKDTLANTSWLFGSGPGTFEIDYHQYKPASVNLSEFWNLSFNRSGSHILTTLTTAGIAVTLVYLIVLLVTMLKAVGWLLRTKKDDKWLPVFILTLGWIILAASQFLYSSNTTILSLLWLFGAAMLSAVLTKSRTITYKKTPKASFALSFGFVVCAILIVTTGFITISRYAADVSFAKAVAHSEYGDSTDEVIEDLVSATQLNKWSDIYARNLSQALLVKTAELLTDPDVNPEAVQGYIANTVYYAQRAVELSPNVVANQSMLGDVYREMTPFISGADAFAIQAYESTILLSPVNPVFYVSLGRAYIAQADLLDIVAASEDEGVSEDALAYKEQVLDLAVQALMNALLLKNDYSIAQYYLSLTYERQGNLTDAIAGLEALQDISPYDAGLAFQLGVLYLQQGKLDEAQVQLEYVVELSPDYSNARWFLSSVFEQQGEIELAIEQVEIVLEENPDNELIIQRLERLQEGLVSEEELEPLEEGEGVVE